MDALLSLSNDLAAAVERAAPAVVAVHARRLPSTGIHWRPGIVVTAEHTVRTAEDITVTMADGRSLPAVLAGRDPGTDLAVLRVADAGSVVATLGDDAALKVGHMVLALGYGPRASWGVISALGPRWRSWRGGDIDRLVRLDLVLYPGFSGGPLVDAAGRVVGLNTSGLARETRLALPVTMVTRVADELLQKGHVSRGYLGLGMQPVRLPEPLRAQLGLGDGALIVVMVEPSGPAARAGVLLGDVLVALDGEPVGDLDDVQARLGSDRVGAEISAVVLRGGVRTELRITVGEQPRRRA
ncbi:MAG TPA: trypsin-like peptidase domain-containing protein [Candidatus Acidoferrum sp.]|jgi:S1-C subfamily serine protease|nr:trypsin-like peptidase domain-containing protein [Candidatus Acidoferrum sp.]